MGGVIETVAAILLAIGAVGFGGFRFPPRPQHTREHFHNARIEVLKGMRSLLDARIEHLSKHDRKGSKVTVE